jgi:drug/metabolite transporter (DMT)-like permease
MAPTSPVGILEVVSLALFLAFCGAGRAAAYRRLGDDSAIARLRAVEDLGGPQLFAILGGIAVLLPFIVVHPANAAYAVALAFAGVGALGFAPALATACEMLVPRRRSVEELYRRR